MRKLDTSEKIESFDCGDTDLNDFILNESFLYREALLAVSYVLENKVNQRSVAYFSLANDRISLSLISPSAMTQYSSAMSAR